MKEGRVERKFFKKLQKKSRISDFSYFIPKHLEIQNKTSVKSIHRSFTFIQVISVQLTIITVCLGAKNIIVIVTRRNMFELKNKSNSNEKKPRNIVFEHIKTKKLFLWKEFLSQ